MKSLLAVLCLLSAPLAAQNVFELTSNMAIVGDVATTIHTLRSNPLAEEQNLLMPKRPTNGTVYFWGALALTANEGLTRFLFPPRQRPYVWALVTVVESYAILRNRQALHMTAHIVF